MAKSKTKNAAKMDSKDVKYLIEMLNKHHEELQDAQQERHDQLVADLQYDLVFISKGSNANNPVCRNIFQSGSKSPLKTIRAAGSDLNSSVAAKGVKAKSKTRLVKTSSEARNLLRNCLIEATRRPSL